MSTKLSAKIPESDSAEGLRVNFEDEVIGKCLEAMGSDAEKHPEWAARRDALDPSICSREELVRLIADSPTAFSAGILFGYYSMRQEVAQITERPFD